MVVFAIDCADNMNEFVIGDFIEGEKLQVEVFTNFEAVIFMVWATLEAVFVNDFHLVVKVESRKFISHEFGVGLGGAISGFGNVRNEVLSKSKVTGAEFDIKIFGGGLRDD